MTFVSFTQVRCSPGSNVELSYNMPGMRERGRGGDGGGVELIFKGLPYLLFRFK